MEYLESLNPPQREAVQCTDGPVMVIAGPGSGKTRVLTYRIAYLIQSGVLPWNILALTFTNKAAREMKDRIEKVVGSDANKVGAGTFHSMFARILRIEAPKIGFPGTFTIYDTSDSRSVIKDIINQLGLEKKSYPVSSVHSRISSAKSNLITWKKYANSPELLEADRFSLRPAIHKIYERYTKRLEQNGAMDFDDLLLNMFKLLHQNSDDVLQKYRRKFEYVLVDEFQDTNFLQYAIIKLLCKYEGSPENICIVGDDAQSIYAFRGATIENILKFQKDFPKNRAFKLEQNYRSSDFIVQAANDVISHNQRQLKKTIWTEKEHGNKIKVIRALSDTEEGRKVISTILELKNRDHFSNKDIAILYRTNAQSRVFEEYLRRQDIPYRIYGGLSFYQRKEVKDLLAWMRLVVNPHDDEALKRATSTPRRGIGAKTLEKLLDFSTSAGGSGLASIEKAPLTPRVKNRLMEFLRLIVSIQKFAKDHNAYDAALMIFRKSGLEKMYKEDTSLEGVNRMENLSALLDGIQEFTENDEENEISGTDRSLATYLQSITLMTDFDTQSEDDEDFISLMTAHAAKGLEYPAVFVVGLEENLFPSYMSMKTQDDIDEERRLFYVAITRAERRLFLTYANSRYQYGQMRNNDVSRFVEEIKPDRLDEAGAHMVTSGRAPAAIRSGHVKKIVQKYPKVNLDQFEAAPVSTIAAGQTVRHMKFGDGQVLKVDGNNDSRVATIEFKNIDNPKRRIMLKFAKLMVVE